VASSPFAGLPAAPLPWLCVLVSGVIGIALAHVFYYAALQRIGATIQSIILLTLPFSVLALSVVVFREPVVVRQWAWGLALVAGAALATLAKRKK
jgi:drug/metabolite transporter (DMT)-like permease